MQKNAALKSNTPAIFTNMGEKAMQMIPINRLNFGFIKGAIVLQTYKGLGIAKGLNHILLQPRGCGKSAQQLTFYYSTSGK